MTTEAKTKTVYRDSIDGHFVIKKEAVLRPSTTGRQRLRSRVKPEAGKLSSGTSKRSKTSNSGWFPTETTHR